MGTDSSLNQRKVELYIFAEQIIALRTGSIRDLGEA